MKQICRILLVFSLLAWASHVAANPTQEGCHLPEPTINGGKFVGAACINCAEDGPGTPEFVQAWVYLRRPDPGQSWTATTFCRYHNSDLLTFRTPGIYDVGGGECAPGVRAVATRVQLTVGTPDKPWNAKGLSDGGCDAPGPACTPGWPCGPDGVPISFDGFTPAAPHLLLVGDDGPKKPKHTKAKMRVGTCIVDKHLNEKCKWEKEEF